MSDKNSRDEKANQYFEELWSHQDFWQLETSQFENEKYDTILSLVKGRHYGRVLEIGCGSGTFSRLLGPLADQLVAIDISKTAIDRAKENSKAFTNIDFQAANIMDYDVNIKDGWDLVVMSETIYYLGWLYSFYEVGSLAAELNASMKNGGRLILANTRGKIDDFSSEMALLTPWIIDTYRDLFLNVGFKLEKEKIFHGIKDNGQLDVLISVCTTSKE